MSRLYRFNFGVKHQQMRLRILRGAQYLRANKARVVALPVPVRSGDAA